MMEKIILKINLKTIVDLEVINIDKKVKESEIYEYKIKDMKSEGTILGYIEHNSKDGAIILAQKVLKFYEDYQNQQKNNKISKN